MNKVATTYWDNMIPSVNKNTKMLSRSKSERETGTTQLFAFAIILTITFMLCLAVNFRASSELNLEVEQHQKLSSEIEVLTTQNASMQSEIHGLKSDPKMVEREARKLGMGRPDEKIFVPTN